MSDTSPDGASAREPTHCLLDRLWEQGERPDAGALLAEAGVTDPAGIAVALAVDQWRRWHAGERVTAEDYFARFPRLAESAEAAVELIYGELLVREELGERPDTGEFLTRFPQWAERLREQLRVHAALAADSGMPTRLLPPSGETTWRPGRGAPAAGARRLPHVPGYEVLEELGHGGMGVVYKARHLRLNRVVALKMVRAGAHADPEELVRFLREAELAARLQHPNIVQIFEVGTHDDLPFITLEYVEGGTLSQKLAGKPLPPAEAAALLEPIIAGVRHAHAHGVVHRDLKPANILLRRKSESRNPKSETNPNPKISRTETKRAEVSDFGPSDLGIVSDSDIRISDLEPKVTDFGLARLLETGEGLTQAGTVLGTPGYMAPEQARGDRDVGPAADVYALGALLYELLTGRPPFVAATTPDTLMQVLTLEPVPPGRLQPGMPRDLETVCLKCLQKEPARRYASADDLAEDLERFRSGRPVLARRAGRAERALKWVRRRPAAAALWAIAVLAVVLAVGGAVWLERSRAEWRAEVARGVEQALGEARELRAQARNGGPRTMRFLAGALAAARQAQALLEQGGADESLGPRVAALLAELEEEVSDRRTVQHLEALRLVEYDPRQRRLDYAKADRGYAEAFAACGMDLKRLAPAEAAARVRARPIRETLVTALEHWAYVRRSLRPADRASWGLPLEVACLAAPEPARDRFRAALLRGDAAGLRALTAEEALETLPVPTLVFIGNVLHEQGDRVRAARVLRHAQRKGPHDFWANYELAQCLAEQRPPRRAEAVRFYSAALAVRSQDPLVLFNLGNQLYRLDRKDDAVFCFRQATRLRDDFALAHHNLGRLLEEQGHFAEALREFRRAHELGPPDPQRFSPAGRGMRRCERRLSLSRQLPQILEGKRKPTSIYEYLEFGQICFLDQRYAAAADFFRDFLAGFPGWLAGVERNTHRYNAVQAAVLAGCGRGKDAGALDEAQRTRWRKQALAWLRKDLGVWAKQLKDRAPEPREEAMHMLWRWREDPDLEAVRGPAALARLPQTERDAWLALWAEVESLVAPLAQEQ
jgi:serine/threonine protein kinase/tetratricopeptide (TPR) repeat protein